MTSQYMNTNYLFSSTIIRYVSPFINMMKSDHESDWDSVRRPWNGVGLNPLILDKSPRM